MDECLSKEHTNTLNVIPDNIHTQVQEWTWNNNNNNKKVPHIKWETEGPY